MAWPSHDSHFVKELTKSQMEQREEVKSETLLESNTGETVEEEVMTPEEALSFLLQTASEQHYITYEDILTILPEVEENLDLLEELFARLQAKEIPVYESVEEAEKEEEAGAETAKNSDEAATLNVVPVGDTVDLYFREMGREPLLTAEEEVALAKRLVRGEESEARLREDETLSLKDIRALEAFIADAEDARQTLIKANTRLVISVAKRYIGQGVPFLDLIQEGNLGLMKAVDKFDYTRGYKFSTYATWWIRQAVSRAVADQGRTIRLPVHVGDKLRQLHRAAQSLEQKIGHPPSPEEIAVELELPPERVRRYLRVSRRPLSLEQPVGEEEESNLGQFIEDEGVESPPDAAEQTLLREKMEDLLDTLRPREARILRLRFGFQDGHTYTLEEVGHKFGLTRERIRQIEAQALARLRHPSRSRQLRDYM